MYPFNKNYPFNEILTLDGKTIDLLHDVIGLNTAQREKLREGIKHKTLKQWRNGRNSLTVRLTSEQTKEVVRTKNAILKEMSFKEVNASGIIKLSDHGEKRAIKRIDKNNPYVDPISPLTELKIIKAVINSQKISTYAEWSGYPNLSFLFRCVINEEKFNIAVAFEKSLIVVTIIDK